jgi:UDP-N-acetyl-D-mannosaminuronate dehydrogenase
LRVFDPKAVSINTQYGEFKSREKMDEEIKWADCIIILTDHQEFKENKDILNSLGSKDKVIIDTRNTLDITNGSKLDCDNYIKL